MKTNQLSHHLPDLVSETQARIKDIVESCGDKARGGHGIFNPYDEVLRVAYTLLLCQFGAKEMLRDQAVLERSKGWVQTLMASQSVTQIIFPWLGKFLSFRRTLAGIQLFRLIGNLQKARERNNIREDDWLQHLMDEGHNTLTILTVRFAIASGDHPSLPLPPRSCRTFVPLLMDRYGNSTFWLHSLLAQPTPPSRPAMFPRT